MPVLPNGSLKLSISSFSLPEFTRYLSSDYERFALSSAESFVVSKLEFDKYGLTSWPLLKLYYSAFFAAHAVMRSQGAGVIKIENAQAVKLNQFLKTLNPLSPNFKPGMYEFRLNASVRDSPSLTLQPHGGGSGVHEAFWKSFCSYLDDLSRAAVATKAADAEAMAFGSIEVRNAISGNSGSSNSWLSQMRNQINYQHQHSVWFPIRKSGNAKGALAKLSLAPSKSSRLDTSVSKEPLRAFIEVSSYLSFLNFDIAEYVAARSTVGAAFGQKWRRFRSQIS